jgi:hypothetical protein
LLVVVVVVVVMLVMLLLLCSVLLLLLLPLLLRRRRLGDVVAVEQLLRLKGDEDALVVIVQGRARRVFSRVSMPEAERTQLGLLPKLPEVAHSWTQYELPFIRQRCAKVLLCDP